MQPFAAMNKDVKMQEADVVLNDVEQAYFESRGATGLVNESGERDESAIDVGELDNSALNDKTSKEPNMQKTVPHAALHAEREEHKKTRALLSELREEAELLKSLLDTTSQKKSLNNESDVPPDPEKDFIGFTRWQANEIKRLREDMAAEKQRENDARQQVETENALWGQWSNALSQSRSEIGDLDTALNFLGQARDNQLKALAGIDGRFNDAGFRTNQMRNELRDIVAASLKQGENPAKALYEVAKGYGYGGQNGARFKALGEAQNAARTLAATNGRDAGDPMLLETLAGLSEAEFAKWYDNNRDNFRKMFGG